MSPGHALLRSTSYLTRVTTRDGRAIEEALAPATLLDEARGLHGVVIEASYAFNRPPLLKRLREDAVPRIVDPQTVRFTGRRFLQTETLKRLPYAPSEPLSVLDFDGPAAKRLAGGALRYAQDRGTDVFLAPGVHIPDGNRHLWIDHNERLLEAACNYNGSADIDRLPIIAHVAPGARAIADPDETLAHLLDYPVNGVYVQPTNLRPTHDSLEKLAALVQFLAVIREHNLPVVVGRVGAFGLLLQAMGFELFDSGLGHAESHVLAGLNREITEAEFERRRRSKNGGASRRVYFEPLKTTMPAAAAQDLLENNALKTELACSLGCCRFRAPQALADRARSHYVHTRQAEVEALRSLPVPAMRLAHTENKLRDAQSLARRVEAVVENDQMPKFDHLDRWLRLLAREQAIAHAA